MATLFPWATKEYLLWEMSIGQVILYHNLGIEMRYGKREESEGEAVKSVDKMSAAEIRAKREELRRQFGDIGGG